MIKRYLAQGLAHRYRSLKDLEHQEMSFQVCSSGEAADGIFHVTPVGHRKLICDRGGEVDT